MKITKQLSLSAATIGAAAALTNVSASADTNNDSFINSLSSTYEQSIQQAEVGGYQLTNDYAFDFSNVDTKVTNSEALGASVIASNASAFTPQQQEALRKITQNLNTDLNWLAGLNSGVLFVDVIYSIFMTGMITAASWANSFLITELFIGIWALLTALVSGGMYLVGTFGVLDVAQFLVHFKFGYDILQLFQLTGYTQEVNNLLLTWITSAGWSILHFFGKNITAVLMIIGGALSAIPIISWIGGAINILSTWIANILGAIPEVLLMDMYQGARTNLTSAIQGFGNNIKSKEHGIGMNNTGFTAFKPIINLGQNADAISNNPAVNELSRLAIDNLAGQSAVDSFQQGLDFASGVAGTFMAVSAIANAWEVGFYAVGGAANTVIIGWPFAGMVSVGALSIAGLIKGIGEAIAAGAGNMVAIPQVLGSAYNKLEQVYGANNKDVKAIKSGIQQMQNLAIINEISNFLFELIKFPFTALTAIPLISFVPAAIGALLAFGDMAWNFILGIGRMYIIDQMSAHSLNLTAESTDKMLEHLANANN